jgi:hypothetical protein
MGSSPIIPAGQTADHGAVKEQTHASRRTGRGGHAFMLGYPNTGEHRVADLLANGVNQRLLRTMARSDGTMQLPLQRSPAVHFCGNAGPTSKGESINAIGANWYV